MVWDEDTIAHLRELWAQGLSTAEIGRRLGVSKNAIVGKAHRLELDGRPSPIRRAAVKPAEERASLSPRLAGPTLPPLPSEWVHAVVHAAGGNPEGRCSEAGPGPGYAKPEARPADAGPGGVKPELRRVDAGPVVLTQASVPRALVVRPVVIPAPRAVVPSATIQSRRSAPSCCWPIGEPGTKSFRFCEDVSVPGKPYCDEHAKLAYVKIRDRKEDAA